MSAELKPCPFCGGSDIIVTHETADACVYCSRCFGEIKLYRRGVIASDLDAKWNTRPIEDALRSELASKDEKIEGWKNISLKTARHARAEFTRKDNLIAAQRDVIEAYDERDAIEGHSHLFEPEAHLIARLAVIDKLAAARHRLNALEQQFHGCCSRQFLFC